MGKGPTIQGKLFFLWLLVFVLVLIWSAIRPHDYFTWFLEVLPAILGILILALTFREFQFTSLAYRLILIHSIILMIGGHYTYAEVPIFNWIRDAFDMSRNNYDKVGHFAQGFFPAIIAREILIRKALLKQGKLLSFIVVCICLAISAFYELVEWWVVIVTGSAAEAFLGTQGDIWDTQSDMFFALIGAITSLIFLSKIHDNALSHIYNSE
jgi:putative membrane protein